MQQTGLRLGGEVSLKIDWQELAAVLGKVATHFFSGNIPETVASAFEAIKAIKKDVEPGHRAWQLFALSFAQAFGDLRVVADDDGEAAKQAVQEAIAAAKAKIKGEEHVLPIGFLDQPTAFPLYKIIRDEFVKRRHAYRGGDGDGAKGLAARFDSAFNRAVFTVWSKDPERFRPILDALTAPGAHAHDFELQWAAYRRQLKWEFEVKPVFGQEETKVSLGQLYVPLRAVWEERQEVEGPARFERDERRTILHVVKLDEALDQWIAVDTAGDWLRLIGGGPGSGKSTTAKALACRLADRADIRPLFIPLQHIRLEGDLREQINQYFIRQSGGAFRAPPLAREAVENGPPLVLIFDGLDELVMPDKEAAKDVAIQFAGRLNALHHELRDKARMVVTGRMPAFQAAQPQLCTEATMSLVVAGFLPFGPHTDRGDPYKGTAKLLKLDQRPLWWAGYARATGQGMDLPPALSDDRLEGLSGEPLLCYLLALSGYAVERWQEAAENPNRVYGRLVDSVWQRAWGDGDGKGHRRQGPRAGLPKDQFNTLMETIALAAWRGGDTRAVEEKGFEDTLKMLKAEPAWTAFKDANGPDLGNLAMNFYLKGSESHHRGFEFTHKSFGDYLAARALLNMARRVSALDIDDSMPRWLRACGTGELGYEILNFLRDEARDWAVDAQGLTTIREIKGAFEAMASAAIRQGFPAHGNTEDSWRQAELRQNRAEAMTWAVINACALALWPHDAAAAQVTVDWGGRMGLGGVIHRLKDWPAGTRCLSLIQATGQGVHGARLSEADLRGAEFTGCGFVGAMLFHALLDDAVFEECFLTKAWLEEASLLRTRLTGSYLVGAGFVGATFEDTDLSKAVLDRQGAERQGLDVKHLQRHDSGYWETPNGTIIGPGRGGALGKKRL